MAGRYYIRHPESGEQYKVDDAGFDALYAERGFVKVGDTRAAATQADASAEPQPAPWHDGMTVADLRDRAKELGLSGYTAMNRDALVSAIEDV